MPEASLSFRQKWISGGSAYVWLCKNVIKNFLEEYDDYIFHTTRQSLNKTLP